MADGGPAYQPRKPSSAPSEGSLAERDAFTALARQSLPEVRASAEDWRTVEAYQIAVADQATGDLDTGRRLVVAALASLLIGVGVSWWAPSTPTDPPTYLRVTSPNTSACGTLRSADGGQVRLSIAGNHDPISIPLTQVTTLAVVATCG